MHAHDSSPRLRHRARQQAPRLTAAALLLAGLAGAQAQTWSGGSLFSNSWSDPFNWQGLGTPQSSASTVVTFGSSSRRLSPVQDLGAPFTLNALVFNSSTPTYQLSGNALRFAGTDARLTQAGGTTWIGNELQVAANLAVDVAGGLVVGGNLTRATGTDRSTLVLTKRGSGTLALDAANSFDAIVRVDAGQVWLRHTSALAHANVLLNLDNGLNLNGLAQATLGGLTGAGALTLGNTQLVLNGSDTLFPYSGSIRTSGTGSVVKNGTNTVRWTGNSGFDSLQVNSGRLQLEGGTLTLSNAEQGLFVGSGSTTSGSISTLSLSGGATASALGRTVQVDGIAGTALSITGTRSKLSTGFQTLVGNHASGRADIGSGGTLAANGYLLVGWDDGGNGTMNVNAGGTVSSNAGVVGGLTGSNGQVDVNGSGASWLSQSLGIGGFDTNLRGGTGSVTVRDGAQIQVTGALGFWTAGASATVNGGTLRAGSLGSTAGIGSINLQADPAGGAALVLDGAASNSFAGSLSGAGSLLKTGSGAQTLAGASAGFTGVTTIQGGRIVVGHQDALRGSQVKLNVANGLDVNGLANVMVGSLAGNGALALGSTQFTLGLDNRDASFGGVLSGAGAVLVKKGTGTQTLTATNSALSRLVAEGGGKVVMSGGSLGLSGDGLDLPALVLNTGGTLQVLAGAKLALSAGSAFATLDGDSATALLVDGRGSRMTLTNQLRAGSVQQGRVTVRNGGELEVGFALLAGFGAGSAGSFSFESGAQVLTQHLVTGLLAGSTGTVSVSGAGTRLQLTGEAGLGGFSTLQNGGTGTLVISDGGSVTVPQLRLWNAGSSLRIDGGSLSTDALTGAAGSMISLVADPASGRALTLGGPSGTATFSGDIDGDGGLRKTGTNTQVLGGRNSFTGMVQVQGGTLVMASSGASEYEVGAFSTLQLGERNLGYAVVQAASGGQVIYTNTTLNGGLLIGPGGHDIGAVRRMVGTRVAGGTVLTPGSGTSFVGVVNDGEVNLLPGRSLTWTGGSNPGGKVTFAGNATVSNFRSGGEVVVPLDGTLVSTAGNLVMTGGSRTRVGAVNEPGGTIELRDGGQLQLDGALLVNNGRIVGPVQVNYGSLAKGAGEFGQVIVSDGGRFSPGNSPGQASTADVTWGAGGGFDVELASATGTAGVDWDLWRVHGVLSVAAGTTANSRFTVHLATLGSALQPAPLASFDAGRSWEWRIVDTDGGILGFDPTRVALDTQGFLSPLAGGQLQLAVRDGDLYLQFTAAVPEPQTWALLLGGLGVLGWAARRRAG